MAGGTVVLVYSSRFVVIHTRKSQHLGMKLRRTAEQLSLPKCLRVGMRDF